MHFTSALVLALNVRLSCQCPGRFRLDSQHHQTGLQRNEGSTRFHQDPAPRTPTPTTDTIGSMSTRTYLNFNTNEQYI